MIRDAHAEAIRSKLRALHQVEINARDARALLAAADAAYAEALGVLGAIRRDVEFAAVPGVRSQQKAVRQIAVDAALESLRGLVGSARYEKMALVDGSAACRVVNVGKGILGVRPRRVRLNPVLDPTPFRVTVERAARQATVAAGRALRGSVTIRLTGPSGWVDIPIPAGGGAELVEAVVNQSRNRTGVYASEGLLHTERFGSAATLRVEQISGDGCYGGGDPLSPGLSGIGAAYLDRGEDARLVMDGVRFRGDGTQVWVDTVFFAGWIDLDPAGASAGTFEIERSGLTFKVGAEWGGLPQPILGLPSVAPEALGPVLRTLGGRPVGGALSTVQTGAGNDLFSHPENARRIVRGAQEDVRQARLALATFLSVHLDAKERAREVAVANLEASELQFPHFDGEFEKVRTQGGSGRVLALVS